jgi:hypothetical protein
MAKIKVLRAYDPYVRDSLAFSIVADDNQVEFVFSDNHEMFDGKQRVAYILDSIDGAKPKSAEKWLELGLTGLESFNFKPVLDVDYDDFKSAVSEESDYLNTNFVDRATIDAPSQEFYNVYVALSNLAKSDKEIEEYLDGVSTELPLEKRKLLMATMIIAADTVDENPWLMPWLNGEELDPKDVDTTLVLSKPFINSVLSESLVNYEGETE